MPKCVKCNWKTNYDEGFGNCLHCGVNRGWEKINIGVHCCGCKKGYTEFHCPKCNHTITGNDLISTTDITSEDVMGCFWIIVTLLFIATYFMAQMA